MTECLIKKTEKKKKKRRQVRFAGERQKRHVHSRLVRVRSALGLVLFLDGFLRRPTEEQVPRASTSGAVRRRLAGTGSGSGLGVVAMWRNGHVARATAAKRMLLKNTQKKKGCSATKRTKRKSGDPTYHAIVAGLVDAVDRLAVIGTTTAERSLGGQAETGSLSESVSKDGVGFARRRADVSSPATSGGNDLSGRQTCQGRGSRERRVGKKTSLPHWDRLQGRVPCRECSNSPQDRQPHGQWTENGSCPRRHDQSG